jgi:hypothetical protein
MIGFSGGQALRVPSAPEQQFHPWVVTSHSCPLVQSRLLDTPEVGQYALEITRAMVVVPFVDAVVVFVVVVGAFVVVLVAFVVVLVALVVVVVVEVVVDFLVVVVVDDDFVGVVVALVMLDAALVVVVVGAVEVVAPSSPVLTYGHVPTQAAHVLDVPPAHVPAVAPFCTSQGVFSGSYEHAAFVQPVATPLT